MTSWGIAVNGFPERLERIGRVVVPNSFNPLWESVDSSSTCAAQRAESPN